MLQDDSIPFNVYLFGQYRKVFKSEKFKPVKVDPLSGFNHGHHIEKNTPLLKTTCSFVSLKQNFLMCYCIMIHKPGENLTSNIYLLIMKLLL